MSQEFEEFVQLLLAFGEADEAVRVPACNALNKMWKVNPMEFARRLLIVIKEGAKVPLRAFCMAMVHATTVFKKATNIARTNDATLACDLIDAPLANEYIDVTFPLFTTGDTITNLATSLFAHVTIYIMERDKSVPVLPMICQKLQEPNLMLPCAKCLECLFSEAYIDQSIQAEVMKITVQLMGQELTLETKAQLIKVVAALIPALPDLLHTPEDNSNFLGAMLQLTTVPELKASTYDFWEKLALSEHIELFAFCPRFAEVSFADMTATDRDDDILKKIFLIWQHLSDFGFDEESDAIKEMVMRSVPEMLPVFINFAEMVDTDELDQEDSDALFLEARFALSSFAFGATDACLPVLMSYAEQFLNSSEVNRREMATYVFQILTQRAPPQEEMTEQWANILKQTVPVAIAKLSDPSPRIVLLAVNLIGLLAKNYPSLHDFPSLAPQLLPVLDTPLGPGAYSSVASVICLVSDPNALGQVCNALLEKGTGVTLKCLCDVLDSTRQAAIAGALMTKAIAMAEIIAEEGDLNKIEDILDVLHMMVVLVGREAIGAYDHLFRFALQCLTQMDSPRALVLLESLAVCLSNPTYTLPAINQILTKLADSESTLMRKAAVAGVRELARLGIQDQFGDCLHKLLGIFDDQSVELELRIDCLDAINALHEAYPQSMQSFYNRLIPMYKTVIVGIPQIAAQDDSVATEACEYTLGAIHLMIAVVFDYPRDVAAAKANLIEMAISAIKEAVGLRDMSAGCMISVIDVCKALLQHYQEQALSFIRGSPDLVELLKAACQQGNPVITEESRKILALLGITDV